MPSTFGRRELTGNTVPPNGLETRFHMIVRPTLPGRSVAPITATVSGRKIASSDPPSYPRTSCAGSPLLDRFIVAPLSLLGSRFRVVDLVAYGRPRRAARAPPRATRPLCSFCTYFCNILPDEQA